MAIQRLIEKQIAQLQAAVDQNAANSASAAVAFKQSAKKELEAIKSAIGSEV